tara:strand:- start:136 stop:888 length:753 start_codon:yes stop_codon:yes gene_type:complete
MESYLAFADLYKGETAWIVGAGPSLLGWYNHEKKNEIFNDIVISVNSAIFAMPWGGYPHPNKDIKTEVVTERSSSRFRRFWVSNDSLCRRWSWWDFLKSKHCHCDKIVRNSWEPYYSEIPDFFYFWPRPTSEGVINPDDQGLAYCSSVPTSIDLAIQMGCKNIYLLGVDQEFVQGKSHYWQFFPRDNQPTRIDRVMATLEQQNDVFQNYNPLAFDALQKFANVKNVKILNVNPNSKVDSFEKVKMEEILG